jgi:hypothetical protein
MYKFGPGQADKSFSSLANFCFKTKDLLALAVRERLQNDPKFLSSHNRVTVTINPANITVRVLL